MSAAHSHDSAYLACPQVKICGLTRPHEALACAQMGVDAVGLVFFPKSPRHVSRQAAKSVVEVLKPGVAAVGVFVNASLDFIMQRVDDCGLSMVQLHGQEPPELVSRLRTERVLVIKALFLDGAPGFGAAKDYPADAFLVECAKGPLPGGNAKAWDWGAARNFSNPHPLVLAGGLNPENVARAIHAGRPAAVDVSSGVEMAPGRKDPQKVARLLAAVQATAGAYDSDHLTPVFYPLDGSRYHGRP
jgi:phosphoribosylanthranilate isomerase